MIDVEKQIGYWLDGAKEDWDVAVHLVENERYRHGLFFAHLALEKALKAHVCRKIQDVAPKIHGLVQLAEIAEIKLTQDQFRALSQMTRFNIKGRYPETSSAVPSKEKTQYYMKSAEAVFNWLISQL